jgi:hypothetical protein
LLEPVAEAALVLWQLFCDSRHHELRTLATFLDEAVDPALCDLKAALSAAGYEDDGAFAGREKVRRREKPRQLQTRPEEKGEDT